MPNNTVTIEMTREEQNDLVQRFAEFRSDPPAYAFFRCRLDGCSITCYNSGKTVFQGRDAELYAAPFRTGMTDILPQAGSDEVGTGDFFGPVCVSAVYLRESDISLIRTLGIQDSKQMNDGMIRKCAPLLREQLIHTVLVVTPEKYNAVHRSANMNAVKALLHNQAYINLRRKTELPGLIVNDQFTPEQQYYRYLSSAEEIIRDIRFETKAENKYPAVAAASVIARAAFLDTMDQMSRLWDMEFVKGAGTAADECGKEFIERYGKNRLGQVAKLHFKNTERII